MLTWGLYACHKKNVRIYAVGMGIRTYAPYIHTYIHMPVKYQVVSTVEPHVTTTAEIENTYICSFKKLINIKYL